jgi:SAM-dependent methyltransferase
MHVEACHFLTYVFNTFQVKANAKVLDVGSGDINGNNRVFFPTQAYIGCDVAPGRNVDIVSPCHLLEFSNEFDVIISSECFEHDMYYQKSMQNIVTMLKPGGLFTFTCASTGRPEHGTLRTTKHHSFTTQLNDDAWGDYYKNLADRDVTEAIDLSQFSYCRMYCNPIIHDLYFVGIKCYPEYASE